MTPHIDNATTTAIRRCCRLLHPVRDREGHQHFADQPEIVREVENLDRHMYLVRFCDGATTFVFPHEVEIVDLSGLQAEMA